MRLGLGAQARGVATPVAGWLTLQRHGVRQAMASRGPSPSMSAAVYGLLYANGQPEKMAPAFGLWSEQCRFAGGLASTSCRPEPRAPAGRRGEGKPASLVANLTPRLLGQRRARGRGGSGGAESRHAHAAVSGAVSDHAVMYTEPSKLLCRCRVGAPRRRLPVQRPDPAAVGQHFDEPGPFGHAGLARLVGGVAGVEQHHEAGGHVGRV